jgi:hypothetical protein
VKVEPTPGQARELETVVLQAKLSIPGRRSLLALLAAVYEQISGQPSWRSTTS